MPNIPTPSVQRVEIEAGATLECFAAGGMNGLQPTILAAHPAEAFDADTAALLARISGAASVCVNPCGVGGSKPDTATSIEAMVDGIERAREQLGLGPIVFWGMSGGGWLAEAYARRHPAALAGVIIESACACFRARLFDPECALSPLFPQWREKLEPRGLVPQAIAEPNEADDAEWISIDRVGEVLRARDGAALLVAPAPLPPLMRRALPPFFRFDARSWLPELEVPALAIAGTADPIVPLAQVRALHAALRGSEFVPVELGTHVPSVQGDERVARVIRAFLAARASA